MIPLFKVHMEEAAVEAASRQLRDPFIGEGAVVDQFEHELEEYLGGCYVLTTNSCTSAIHLALSVLKRHHRRTDDTCWRFLAAPITCLATNMPLLAENIEITWLDTDVNTCNIDLDDLKRHLDAVNDPTMHGYDGVIFVHWGGIPVDMARFQSIVMQYEARTGRQLMVIEDCAHALGSTYVGRSLGSLANVCCFSFQSIKPVTTIDGGCLAIPKGSIHEKHVEDFRLSRWFGLDRHNPDRINQNVANVGFKFHMPNVNAAIGIENLRTYPERLAAQRANAKRYNAMLRGMPGITLLSPPDFTEPTWQLYTILVEDRDGLQRKLKERGIVSSPVHRRNDIHDCMGAFRREGMPGTARLDRTMLCIPVGWWVTPEDQTRIVEVIRSGW